MVKHSIACIAFCNKKVLIAHRNPVGQMGGRWEFPGGKQESGESPGTAVVREIKEETGLDVKDVRYVASQSWPFPDQLMLAFRAEYAGGEIQIQKDEIRDAQFFARDDLPQTPPPGSVAWNLIHEKF